MISAEHDEYDGLAVGWALHALEPAEEHAFADHLATCARCQRLVHESEEALGELAYDVPLVDPPPEVLDRIRHATGASDAITARPIPPPTPITRSSRLIRWAAPAMAAAVVIVALLGWNVALRHQAQQERQVASRAQAVTARLAQSTTRAALRDPAKRAVGYVVQTAGGVEIVSGGATGRLPPNDTTTTTYVLWAVQRSGGPPLAMGTFDVLHTSLDIRPVRGAKMPPGVSGFAISREPGRAVPTRPTEVVASGALQS